MAVGRGGRGVAGGRRARDVSGAGRGAVLGHSAAEGAQERGVAWRDHAVRGPGNAGDRSAERATAGLADADRQPQRQLLVHRRSAGGIRVTRQKR